MGHGRQPVSQGPWACHGGLMAAACLERGSSAHSGRMGPGPARVARRSRAARGSPLAGPATRAPRVCGLCGAARVRARPGADEQTGQTARPGGSHDETCTRPRVSRVWRRIRASASGVGRSLGDSAGLAGRAREPTDRRPGQGAPSASPPRGRRHTGIQRTSEVRDPDGSRARAAVRRHGARRAYRSDWGNTRAHACHGSRTHLSILTMDMLFAPPPQNSGSFTTIE